MTWTAFWVVETGEAQLSLRRFTFGVYVDAQVGDGYYDNRPNHVACPAHEPRRSGERMYQSGHNANVRIDRAPLQRSSEGFLAGVHPRRFADDPRWPTVCEACGGPMPRKADWQVNQDPIYREAHSTTPREWCQDDLPAGALFDGVWHREKGPDGISLVAVMPNPKGGAHHARWALWHIDGRASGGGHWARTGDPTSDPPTVTVTPSINWQGTYHGYLTNGQFTDPL